MKQMKEWLVASGLRKTSNLACHCEADDQAEAISGIGIASSRG